jgi:hypothetical protein
MRTGKPVVGSPPPKTQPCTKYVQFYFYYSLGGGVHTILSVAVTASNRRDQPAH